MIPWAVCRSSLYKECRAFQKNQYLKEYQQPGDVEILYEKNENEEIKRKKKYTKTKSMKMQ